jgi:hypothetical protein
LSANYNRLEIGAIRAVIADLPSDPSDTKKTFELGSDDSGTGFRNPGWSSLTDNEKKEAYDNKGWIIK